MAIVIFAIFVLFVIGLSFYLGRKSRSASDYFAAGGGIHWAVNGMSFAGDYLSAASFLGICGMIAIAGYDGFLYSIGYLAGWIVALFVIAEPMRRMGKYTFTDALDAQFNSKGIQLAASISTLVVSIFYLIPQMVGAGVLVEPLLGMAHHWGVIMVGTIVIVIVATAGMKSTTYVQFLKGSLLIIFSTVLTVALCMRGFTTEPDQGGKVPFYRYATLPATVAGERVTAVAADCQTLTVRRADGATFVKLQRAGETPESAGWWLLHERPEGKFELQETQNRTRQADGTVWVNGAPGNDDNLRPMGHLAAIAGKSGAAVRQGPVGPIRFLAALGHPQTVANLPRSSLFADDGRSVEVFYTKSVPGSRLMRPGLKFKVEGTPLQKLDFVSLMLALFFGTAALPHILIRYYTVRSLACARKSTIVAIAAIGLFYVLTLYMGLGALANGVVNPVENNMSAPLLARSFGTVLFAIISAIAFATVLGTVSGLIVAASGAVAHDLVDRFAGMQLTDSSKVRLGKLTAVTVGVIAIVLGIVFRGMNVSFLVGWAFAVAASANLPALLMLLFWKRTTAQGVTASIFVGIIASVGIILLSPDMYVRYGLAKEAAPFSINQPGILSIPLSFITLVVVSLVTRRKTVAAAA